MGDSLPKRTKGRNMISMLWFNDMQLLTIILLVHFAMFLSPNANVCLEVEKFTSFLSFDCPYIFYKYGQQPYYF